MRSLALLLPTSIREACIYSQDTCKDIEFFVNPTISKKFEYLEIGFEKLVLPSTAIRSG